MAFANRVFRILESELNRHLAFSYTILENESRPGVFTLRPQDVFSFKVTIANNSSIALKRVRGMVCPTSVATFRKTPFTFDSLAPHEQRELGGIVASLIKLPKDRYLSNHIASVNITGQADLSNFWFRDADRPVTYVHPASESQEDLRRRGARPSRLAVGSSPEDFIA